MDNHRCRQRPTDNTWRDYEAPERKDSMLQQAGFKINRPNLKLFSVMPGTKGLLWISPVTQHAHELEQFAESSADMLDFKRFLNFSLRHSTPDKQEDESIDISFPVVDWSERRTSWKDIHGLTALEDAEEWEIPWITGCIESPLGFLSFSLSSETACPATKTLDQLMEDMHIIDELENLCSDASSFNLQKPHDGRNTVHEIQWNELDRQMEVILSDSVSESSIERLKYRSNAPNPAAVLQPKWQWAMSVPLSNPPPKSSTCKPVIEYPFELDVFQKQAIYHLEQGHSVFIAAHTSAGKTVIAEYAAALALSKLTKAVYTSPIKALSNQKYRDFSRKFSPKRKCVEKNSEGDRQSSEDGLEENNRHLMAEKQEKTLGTVGLITGDMQLNPESSSLIVMTTEILRSMLMKSAPVLSDVTTVIFDEVHYMSDPERGVVWEETLIMLPPTIQLVMLSATLPNAMELADWLGRTRGEKIWVITTPQRPVPLEYYLLPLTGPVNTDAIPLSQTKRLKSPALKAKDPPKPPSTMQHGGNKTHQASTQKSQNSAQSKRSLAKPLSTTTKQQPSGFIPAHARRALEWLRHRDLLPAIIFLFSRKRCEEALEAVVKSVGSTSLLTATEQRQVEGFIRRYITTEEPLPQISQTLSALKLGLACHHSGLLPVLKEAIEILFARGLVRLLIATETFAIGINMPARSVVFGELEKPSGRGRRLLTPAEFTQMSGRAGRRGIDSRGIVIVADSMQETTSIVATSMIEGRGTPLNSQFRLTFGTILQLVRRGGSLSGPVSGSSTLSGHILDIGELMRRSFFENAVQRMLPAQAAKLRQAEASLEEAMAEIPNCLFGCSLEKVHLMKALVAEYRENQQSLLKNSKRKIIGRRVSSVSPLVPFLQPGIIIGTGGTTGENLIVQVLLFPIDTQSQWIGPLERPIDDSNMLISELSIQSLLLSDLIFVDNDDNVNGDDNDDALLLLLSPLDRISLLQEAVKRQKKKIKGMENDTICPDFTEHFALYLRLDDAQTEVDRLQHALSVNSLQLLPEYRTRLRILEFLGFIETADKDGAILTLKGRIACEIQTTDELLMTELLVSKLWGSEVPPEDLVALLSLFVFQERTSEDIDEQIVPAHLLPFLHRIRGIARNLEAIQTEAGLTPYPLEINPGLVGVIRAWALGQKFADICQMTEVQEGIIIRTTLRLDEACRDLRNAARIMGDVTLQEKLLRASAMIKRDICFQRSLYLEPELI